MYTLYCKESDLKATLGSVEEGLLSADEGFEALQQFSDNIQTNIEKAVEQAIQQLSKPVTCSLYPNLQLVIDYKDDKLLYQVAKDGNTLRIQGIWKGQQFSSTITSI